MANRSKEDIREYIHEHWKEKSDRVLFNAMLELGLRPTSEIAVTRMRQRDGLIRDGENIRKCLLKVYESGGT